MGIMSSAFAPSILLISAGAWGAGVVLSGCAAPAETPPLTLPEQQEIRDASEADTDVRTINDTGVPPDGPITPGGSSPSDNREPNPSAAATSLPPVIAAEAGESPVSIDTISTGYRTVGGLLAEVNGRAIYSDDIISTVRPDLRGKARTFDFDQFLSEARTTIAAELADRIRNEKSRVVAERNLVAKDRDLARLIAVQWRTKQISEAGGSEARARQLAREEMDASLETLAEQMEGRILGILFYQKNILPRATPSANEVRDYFRRHRDEFRVAGSIDFLLIELARRSGETQEEFAERAEAVHARAAAGEDFAALAGEASDNPLYRQSNGRLPEMLELTQPGQFRWSHVDAAAWNTPVGGVTPLIEEDNGRRRFVAKVIERERPRTLGFDEAQGRITQVLTSQRRQELLRKLEADAASYAAVTPSEEIDRYLETAVEVAAQNYGRWRTD